MLSAVMMSLRSIAAVSGRRSAVGEKAGTPAPVPLRSIAAVGGRQSAVGSRQSAVGSQRAVSQIACKTNLKIHFGGTYEII